MARELQAKTDRALVERRGCSRPLTWQFPRSENPDLGHPEPCVIGEMALAFVLDCVAAPITIFISFEVRDLVETIALRSFLAALRSCASIAVIGMITVVYVAAKVVRAMKPGAAADEYTARKPFWSVVSVGSAVIRSGVIVAVRAIGRSANLHGNLSRCFGSGCHQAASSNSREQNKLESSHKSSSGLRGLMRAPHTIHRSG